MDEKVLKWLYDIKLSIKEIVGEALNRIVKKDESFKNRITGSVAIIGVRNQIIHAYDNISDENIKSILTTHLYLLKKEIDGLINEMEN